MIAMSIQGHIRALLAPPGRRRLARWRVLVERIAGFDKSLRELNDQKLHNCSLSLRYRAKSGEPLDRLLPEAYALVAESAARTLGMRHFEVQYLGGIAIDRGCIAEMETGEGKTLTATLPLFLNALSGRGAHLATANDYLAVRDADWMRPVFNLLGMTVGAIRGGLSPADRRAAYQCDVTYGTAREFGFDFLRDRMLARRVEEGRQDSMAGMLGLSTETAADLPVQRGLHFVVIDEADNILIDEARTPLIISASGLGDSQTEIDCFRWSASVADQFAEERDFHTDAKRKTVELTAEGRKLARTLPGPENLVAIGQSHLYEYVERAIKVQREFHRDQQFVVRDGEVVIVDEYTGRLSEGRRWSGGLHQTVEAKEGLEITLRDGHAAQITVQELCSHYSRLSGMTGTASMSIREFRKVYNLSVVRIPTNRPSQRQQLPDFAFRTADEKWAAIVNETRDMLALGRPVLIGTRSIDKSELLSRRLAEEGIEHQVLNARQLAMEAEIVADAGQSARVTVATNMAGRGTDIALGDGVAEAGGLHVICSEMHDAGRIDRQLIGRCARQGEPGSFRRFLAIDDDILTTALGPSRVKEIRDSSAGEEELPLRFVRLFRDAQRKVQHKHFHDRQLLMHHVKQRKDRQTAMGQDPYLDTPGN
jgi:preprotein translocase subunit SecA